MGLLLAGFWVYMPFEAYHTAGSGERDWPWTNFRA